jgi:hypothetical protein
VLREVLLNKNGLIYSTRTIIPLNRGGTNYITDIQPLCAGCNFQKSDTADSQQATAIIRAGDSLMISQVYPDGMADLGRGQVSVTKIGNSRLITVPQADGSEIRIVLVK